jgi:hypothetical protein
MIILFRQNRGNRGASKAYVLFVLGGICLICLGFVDYLAAHPELFAKHYEITAVGVQNQASSGDPTFVAANVSTTPSTIPLDIFAYNEKLIELANNGTPTSTVFATSVTSSAAAIASPELPGASASTTPMAASTTSSSSTPKMPRRKLWPVKAAYPNAGALLPFNRIVAYYGNFYSTQMGVLGEYPPNQMLAMLASTTAEWAAADPTTPVIPALDYIAVTAQGSPGADGKYRARMPASQIEEAISLANQAHGLVFLDIQVGLSNLQTEIPLLSEYLKLPQVELSVDPEFAVQTSGMPPGTVIGTLDASDINFAANYLANIVRGNNLPPKILVVHRFTEDMVTNYKAITPLPEVEIVMDMDGWGEPAKKFTTYQDFIADEPVQFTGFKLFYKADLRPPSTAMLTPAQTLKLSPQPSYIQYQ